MGLIRNFQPDGTLRFVPHAFELVRSHARGDPNDQERLRKEKAGERGWNCMLTIVF